MAGISKTWFVGCAGAVTLLVAGGLLLGVQPQLARAADADAATRTIELQTDAMQGRLAALSKAAASQGALQTRAAVLEKAVPGALQANTFVRRVNAVAAQDAVVIQSISVGAATAYSPPAASSTGAGGAAPVLTTTDPSITAKNFTVIPMTVSVKGTAAAGLQFMHDMQQDERLYLISSYSTNADPADPSNVLTTLTGSVYALQD